MSKKVYMTVGVPVNVIGCYSEAFMHCGHAGRPVAVELVRHQIGSEVLHSGLVRTPGATHTGFTPGECGILWDKGGYYTYEREEGETGDADPKAVQAELTRIILDALKN